MKELSIIEQFYGDRCAKRSGIPLINHINEGLVILDHLNAKQVVKAAWCLHPILQEDQDMLREVYDHRLSGADTSAIILAMEYRATANSYLSHRRYVGMYGGKMMELVRHMDDLGDRLQEFEMMWQMLVADKIQNYKDFVAQPSGTYENAHVLGEYFLDWIFQVLKLTQEQFREYTDLIKD